MVIFSYATKRYFLLLFLLSTSIFAQELNNYPDEISWCIADIKFDGTQVKVCEFGEAIESKFKGYERLFSSGAMWSPFWQFLGTFNCPVWYVDKSFWKANKQEIALDQFLAINGTAVTMLKALESMPHFSKRAAQSPTQRGIEHAAGIVVVRSLSMHSSVIRTFQKKFPNCLVLGDVTTEFVRSKQSTSTLFDDQIHASFKPKFKIYNKKYHENLASTIIEDLGCDVFVIKPVNASLGYGVIIVDKADLESTLQLILRDYDKLAALCNDRSYSHWKTETSKQFIVEEFALSKTIMVNGKPYDPTMRVVFSLINNNGVISIKFFDGYWKLPVKALDEEGTLIEKHKSQIATHRESSVKVDPQDFQQVQAIMSQHLPHIYLKMLQKRYGQTSC